MRARARVAVIGATGLLAVALAGGTAFADNPHPPGTGGQPNQSCEEQPSTPGNSVEMNSPGSPFNGGVSDGHYAGSAPQNSNNPNSVSQYDVACFQVSGH